MRVPRLPGEARRRIPELALTCLVLVALVNAIHRFRVDGRLPQPFIYDVNDTFMDWFNTALWAHTPGAFDVWRTVYPPISFVFLRIFGIPHCYAVDQITARDCDYVGITTILVSYALCVIVAGIAFVRNERNSALFRTISFGLGLPLIFTLERGNLILPCFVFFAIAHGDIVRSRLVRAVCMAITINFKPYLLLPALAHAFRREWRFLELAGIATLVVYLLSYAAFQDGSPMQIAANTENWVKFTNGLIWEQVYYSTSYVPFLEFNTHRFPTRDFIDSKTIEAMVFAIPILVRGSQLLALLVLAGVWVQPQSVSRVRVSLLLLSASLIGQSPGGYTETFLIFLLFLERWERPWPIVALIMGYLLCVPYDYVLSNIITLSDKSWLSGRPVDAPFGLTLGMFIRPGLIVIMFWALAIDTLLHVARAHRSARPAFAMHPDVMLSRAVPA